MSRQPTITILENGQVQISGFDCPLGRVVRQTLDLSPYAGEHIRVWLNENKKFSVDKFKNHYWQIAELDVPPQLYQESEGAPDSEGRLMILREAIPIDLTSVEIMAWDLPEQKTVLGFTY